MSETSESFWLPLASLTHGTVQSNYSARERTKTLNPHVLDLWPGSEVYGFEVFKTRGRSEEESWFRGYVIGNPEEEDHTVTGQEPVAYIGIFPGICVKWDGSSFPLQIAKIAAEQPSVRGHLHPPIPSAKQEHDDADELDHVMKAIDETIQDWSSRLLGYLSSRQYKLFDSVSKELKLLLTARRELFSTIPSKAQRKKLREQALLTITRGASLQNLKEVIRHPETGCVPTTERLTPDDWVVTPLRLYIMQIATREMTKPNLLPEEKVLIDLYLRHEEVGIPSSTVLKQALRQMRHERNALKRLMVEVKATIISTAPGESLELYLSVYNSAPNKRAFITEEFFIQTAKEGQIDTQSGAVLDLDDNSDFLHLVVKVVKVTRRETSGSPGRLPFGIATMPLKAAMKKVQEKVLHVTPWTPEDLFASMHEDLINVRTPTSQYKHRLVLRLQPDPVRSALRRGVLTKSIESRSATQANADIYIKLWSAELPDPLPDEVYVRMTLYSVDNHRLVNCLFPGGSGNLQEGSVEYTSVIWQRFSGRPVFGDLVRLSVSPGMVKSGCVIQFTVIAAERTAGTNGQIQLTDRTAFTVELPLRLKENDTVWIEDGEHVLTPARTGCSFVFRSLTMASFGHIDKNVATFLTTRPLPILKEALSLLRYAPVDELEKHSLALVEQLVNKMAAHRDDLEFGIACLQILASLLELADRVWKEEDLTTVLPTAGVILLNTLLGSLVSRDRSPIIKSISHLIQLARTIAESDTSQLVNIKERMSAIQSKLSEIAIAVDDPVARMLVLKHWPFDQFNHPDIFVKLLTPARGSKTGWPKGKVEFALQILEVGQCDSEVLVSLWRNFKELLDAARSDASVSVDRLHHTIVAVSRLIDVAVASAHEYEDFLDYFSIQALQALMETKCDLAAQLRESQQLLSAEPTILQILPYQTLQGSGKSSLKHVDHDVHALIVSLIQNTKQRLTESIADLGPDKRHAFHAVLHRYLETVAAQWTHSSRMATFAEMEISSVLDLCLIVSRMESSSSEPFTSLVYIADLVKKCDLPDCDVAEDKNVAAAIGALKAGPALSADSIYFTSVIQLAFQSHSTAIRDRCHYILAGTNPGTSSRMMEPLLKLMIETVAAETDSAVKLARFLAEASATWLTVENGWKPALKVIPLILESMYQKDTMDPASCISYLKLLDHVHPYPSVRKTLLIQLYENIFHFDGASLANVLLDLATSYKDSRLKIPLRMHSSSELLSMEWWQMQETAASEASYLGDLGLTGRILASLTVTAEKEGEYARAHEILQHRCTLAERMRSEKPSWRYFRLRIDPPDSSGETLHLIWRTRNMDELLRQVQCSYPSRKVIITDQPDPTHLEIPDVLYLVEVEISTEDYLKPPWLVHDGACTFESHLPGRVMDTLRTETPFPGIFPFARVGAVERRVLIDEELVARNMRGRVRCLFLSLQSREIAEASELSRLLDAALEDSVMIATDNGNQSLLIDWVALLHRGLSLHKRVTQGTPLADFSQTLWDGYKSRYSQSLRDAAMRNKLAVLRDEPSFILHNTFDKMERNTPDYPASIPKRSISSDRPYTPPQSLGSNSQNGRPVHPDNPNSLPSIRSGIVSPPPSVRPGSALSKHIPGGLRRFSSLLHRGQNSRTG